MEKTKKKSRKLVSIIIAVYNMEDLLTRCIYSVCGQTYENLQIILVDDGSTDRSPEICNEFARLDTRIHVVHKENGGLSSARNAGLDQAEGEYVYFLDSDDYMELDLIEKAIHVMEAVKSDWCGFYALKENINGEKMYQISFREGKFSLRTDEDRWRFLLGPFLNYLVGWEVCFHVFRRDIIERNRLRFTDEKLVYAEDLLFSFSYLLYSNEAVILPDVLYHYTDRQESLVNQNKNKNIFPQLHHLAEKMYEAVQHSGNLLVQKQFPMLYLSVMEWHTRMYIAEYGVEQVGKILFKNPWKAYIPENYFLQDYQKNIEKYGRLCGVISVIIVLSEDQPDQTERYVENILKQSIQRLDIVIMCQCDGQIKNKDCRIRYVHVEKMTPDVIFQKGIQFGFGEYIFFADIKRPEDPDFLRSLSDAVKYNCCDIGTVCEHIESTEVCDGRRAESRKRMTALLKKSGTENISFVFRRDFWLNKSYRQVSKLKEGKSYRFSGRIIFYKR